MSFWDLFKGPGKNKLGDASHLQERIEQHLPEASESLRIQVACIAGLFARVVYCDHKVVGHEQKAMAQALQSWSSFTPELIQTIVDIALDEIKTLAGLDDYKYAHQLIEQLSKEERYQVLEALFHLAASDGEVSNLESEEIREIATAMRLEHQHFISARAKVKDYLSALKSNS